VGRLRKLLSQIGCALRPPGGDSLPAFVPERDTLVDDDDSRGVLADEESFQRSGSGSLEVDPIAGKTAPMTGTLELLLCGEPVRRTTQMSAHRGEGKETVIRPHDPYSVPFLETAVYLSRQIVLGPTDPESGRRFEADVGEEESSEPGAKQPQMTTKWTQEKVTSLKNTRRDSCSRGAAHGSTAGALPSGGCYSAGGGDFPACETCCPF